MAKKRKTKKVTGTENKKPRGRDLGEVVYIGAEVMPDIAKALKEYSDKNGIKKRFVIESALRDWLKTRGLLHSM